ncbi:MAG TPA: peptidylprolyl isomerase [Candidatus Angelobacter sp.]|jgi:hypothetical protein|nr:peptidylprolyl isomerase [Candidatus Angelobacter sp.]
MRIIVLTCLFVTPCVFAQPQANNAKPPVTVASPGQPVPAQPPRVVAAEETVLTIHGLCPAGPNGTPAKKSDCTTAMTRSQFEGFIAAINVTNQNYTPPALKNLATGYINVLALAEAGEEAGVDKDPRFQEIMRVERNRALAEAYRRYLREKYSNPPQQEIEKYYNDNLSKFDQTRIERILIPRMNPRGAPGKPGEFEKNARKVADEMRERAAHGEDMTALQEEAYKSLGIQTMPPQTELPSSYKIAQTAAQQDVKALKPGEVTRVELELSGFTIYKLRSKSTLTLEQAKPQIIKEMSEKNIDAALRAATDGVRADYNEDFFNPKIPLAPNPRVIPGSVPTGSSNVRMVPAPANVPQQTPTKPK